MHKSCGHHHHTKLKAKELPRFIKSKLADLTDEETKYIYRNRKGKVIFTPVFEVYKNAFVQQIDTLTPITTIFKDFQDTSKYERYMLNAVQFSAAKTAAEGKLMQSQLFDEKNTIKSYPKFKKDAEEVTKISKTTWLRTEYETARRQAIAGDQFSRMQDDADLYPYWIYKGMMDDREREEHVELEDTVYRIGDPEGDIMYPPNGDNCRCEGESADDQDLAEKGLSVTPAGEIKGLIERNVDERFRYNPANEGILPKTGSYFDVLPSANSADWKTFGLPSSEEIEPEEK